MRLFACSGFKFQLSFQLPACLRSRLSPILLMSAKATLCVIPSQVLRRRLQSKGPWKIFVSVCNRPKIQALNRKFLRKNTPTDVLSFARSEGRFTDPNHEIGDVILCAEVAWAQARERGVRLESEVCDLTAHGILHLFGYDHQTKKDRECMFRLQVRAHSRMAEMGSKRAARDAGKRVLK